VDRCHAHLNFISGGRRCHYDLAQHEYLVLRSIRPAIWRSIAEFSYCMIYFLAFVCLVVVGDVQELQ